MLRLNLEQISPFGCTTSSLISPRKNLKTKITDQSIHTGFRANPIYRYLFDARVEHSMSNAPVCRIEPGPGRPEPRSMGARTHTHTSILSLHLLPHEAKVFLILIYYFQFVHLPATMHAPVSPGDMIWSSTCIRAAHLNPAILRALPDAGTCECDEHAPHQSS